MILRQVHRDNGTYRSSSNGDFDCNSCIFLCRLYCGYCVCDIARGPLFNSIVLLSSYICVYVSASSNTVLWFKKSIQDMKGIHFQYATFLFIFCFNICNPILFIISTIANFSLSASCFFFILPRSWSRLVAIAVQNAFA